MRSKYHIYNRIVGKENPIESAGGWNTDNINLIRIPETVPKSKSLI